MIRRQRQLYPGVNAVKANENTADLIGREVLREASQNTEYIYNYNYYHCVKAHPNYND